MIFWFKMVQLRIGLVR